MGRGSYVSGQRFLRYPCKQHSFIVLRFTSVLISHCIGLLEDKQSEAVSIRRENKRNLTTVLKPWTLTEIQENISSLPKVKYFLM